MRRGLQFALCTCLAIAVAAAIAAGDGEPQPQKRPQIAELQRVPTALRVRLEREIDDAMRRSLQIVEARKDGLRTDARDSAVAAWTTAKRRWIDLQHADARSWPAAWRDFTAAWRRFERRWEASGGGRVADAPGRD